MLVLSNAGFPKFLPYIYKGWGCQLLGREVDPIQRFGRQQLIELDEILSKSHEPLLPRSVRQGKRGILSCH